MCKATRYDSRNPAHPTGLLRNIIGRSVSNIYKLVGGKPEYQPVSAASNE